MNITTTTLKAGKIGQPYSDSLAAAGGTGPYHWKVTVGKLPAGVSLADDGVISGTPSAAGVTPFLVQASDSAVPPQTDQALLSVSVDGALPGPAWLNSIPANFPGVLWKLPYLIGAMVLVGFVLWVTFRFLHFDTVGRSAITFWGGTGFALLLLFFLGAARNPREFLAMFGTAGFGAATGYLIAVFITATGAEGENLSQIKQVVAGALTGVVGTKLLSLWDDLTKGDAPRIFSIGVYLQLVAGLVGFTLSLAAFYTVRNLEAGTVSVTAEREKLISYQLSDKPPSSNGIRVSPSNSVTVQLTGAAASTQDMSVSWKVQPQTLSAQVQDVLDQEEKANNQIVKIDPNLGVLTIKSATDLNREAANFPDKKFPLDWKAIATSRQNTSNSRDFSFRLCRDDNDCPPVKPATAAASEKKNQEKKGSK